ncbi:MAG TPA: GspH/FimT family pseudopilin [Rubrivivax sp.]
MNPSLFTRRAVRRHAARGVTLIESMVVTTVLAIAASTAIPGMGGFKSRQALVNTAAEFETDVQHTRSLAVAGNAALRISFDARDGASCYIVHTGAASDCECGASGEAVCRNGAESQRMVRFADGGPVAMRANVRSIVFDPVRGTSTPTGSVRFAQDSGAAVHQVINVLGRVRSCSPNREVAGYKAC